MAERQKGDVTVYADHLAGLEDGVVVTSHEGPVAEDSTLRSAGGTTSEEDGGGAFRVYVQNCGSLGVCDGSGRKHLGALDTFRKGHELFTHEDGGDVELHAAAGHCGSGKLCGEIHCNVSGRCNGEEKFYCVLAVAVEDGDVSALGKTKAIDECTAACNTMAKLFIGNGVYLVAESGFFGILLCEPVYKLAHCGEIRDAFKLLFGEHAVEILLVLGFGSTISFTYERLRW